MILPVLILGMIVAYYSGGFKGGGEGFGGPFSTVR